MRINLGDKENVEPNLAPLLDCIFLLLIFFLVATTFDKKTDETEEISQLNIVLPDSSAAFATVAVAPNPLVLGVDYRGRYYAQGRQVSVTELHKILQAQGQNDPKRRVRIDGDKNAPLQYLVHLLDLCEFEGLRNIGVRANAD